jgi:F-type H+-transporting ATPase subunit gamma
MASLREIRSKIKSVKNTQQITKAMKMVAASRLRKAQNRILAARPFAQKMEEMTERLFESVTDFEHSLLTPRSGNLRLLLVVTSDKGLCGAFNTNIIREAVRYLRRYGNENVRLIVVGRKGRDYFYRIGVRPIKEYVNFFQHLGFAQAELVTRELLEAYDQQPFAAADAIYSEFKSVIQQSVMTKTLLPVARPEKKSDEKAAKKVDYIFEPSKEELLAGLILRALKAQIFRILLESNASELGAKMTAMDNASRNAKELIDSFTLLLNRTRQASITKEILEVVSGAEALR